MWSRLLVIYVANSPSDLAHIPPVARIVNEDDLYRHPDHANPCTVVNVCRNAALIAARATTSARNGSRDRRRDTASSMSENDLGSARTVEALMGRSSGT